MSSVFVFFIFIHDTEDSVKVWIEPDILTSFAAFQN